MSTRDNALTEFSTLFPDGASSLATTDPEFWAFYSDFTFGETLSHSSLNRHDRLIYQLAATIAVGAHTEFRALLGAALTVGVTPAQIKEVTYQAVAYVGVARGIDYIFATNEEFESRGIAVPVAAQGTTEPATRLAQGLATQKQLVGDEAVDGMYASAPADALHFQEFLSGNCFGDYYTRGTFDLKQRELVTFALLVALGGADNQVKGHVAMNLNAGNTRSDLLDVLTVLVPYIGYPRTLNGLAQINDGAPATA
jgi:4-carboxymuconolactone decarboxylase